MDEQQSFSSKNTLIVTIVVIAAVFVLGGFFVWQYSTLPKITAPEGSQNFSQDQTQTGPTDDTVSFVGSPMATSSFSYPYPIVWQEGGAELSVTGASLGIVQAPRNLNKSDGDGVYQEGEGVYALALNLKVRTTRSWGIPLRMRRLLNEEGDLAPPNTKQFNFSDSGGNFGGENTTYNQEVIFVVPESEQEFYITTGGESNIFFLVTVAGVELDIAQAVPPQFRSEAKQAEPVIQLAEPISVEWIVPKTALTIERGSPIFMGWKAEGDVSSQVQYTYFKLGNEFHYTLESFRTSEKSGFIPADVPPGIYLLEMTKPPSSRKVVVEVTGPSPKFSLATSHWEFDDYYDDDAVIVGDGICSVFITAYIYDTFGYEMSGKVVTVKSNRGEIDSILSKLSITNEDGEIGFFVTSAAPGISKLTASVDGIEFPNALILTVTGNPDDAYCDNF